MKDTSKVTEAMIEAGKKCRLGVTTEKLIEAVLAAAPDREPDGYMVLVVGREPTFHHVFEMAEEEALYFGGKTCPVYIGEAI